MLTWWVTRTGWPTLLFPTQYRGSMMRAQSFLLHSCSEYYQGRKCQRLLILTVQPSQSYFLTQQSKQEDLSISPEVCVGHCLHKIYLSHTHNYPPRPRKQLFPWFPRKNYRSSEPLCFHLLSFCWAYIFFYCLAKLLTGPFHLCCGIGNWAQGFLPCLVCAVLVSRIHPLPQTSFPKQEKEKWKKIKTHFCHCSFSFWK